MNGNFIYSSNRLEVLCDRLSELISSPCQTSGEKGNSFLEAGFQRELILISGVGLKHWLSLSLARKNEICAAMCFWFPNRFLKELLLEQEEDKKASQRFPFEPDSIAWLIRYILLGNDLRENLGNKNQKEPSLELREWLFSRHLARLFDRYLLYRPERLADWQKEHPRFNHSQSSDFYSADEKRQAEIWRELIQLCPSLNLWERVEFLEQDIKKNLLPPFLPPRIFLFGITNSPPLLRRILQILSDKIEIHWFLLRPGASFPQTTNHKKGTEKVYPLLGNSRIVSSDALALLQLATHQTKPERTFQSKKVDLFIPPEKHSLLSWTHRSLYESIKPQGKPPDDDSIQIHSCHSPFREVEVLKDYLLEQFQNDAKLQAEDILVMTTDIKQYAPLVRAVFDCHSSREIRLPYTITDIHSTEEESYMNIFFTLLELGNSRFKASDIMEIFENQWIQSFHSFSEDDLQQIHTWIEVSGICWGIDAKHRQDILFAPCEENHTFSYGIDRLLLSLALPENDSIWYTDVIPPIDIEGDKSLLLGRFASLIQKLRKYSVLTQKKHDLSQWACILQEMEKELLGGNQTFLLCSSLLNDGQEGDLFYPQTSSLQTNPSFIQPTTSLFTEDIGISAISSYLQARWGCIPEGMKFPGEGITFSAFLPMRSVPFSIICLLGMNEESFPRRDIPLEFDLMQEDLKEGDPSPSEEDRLLFMETLLSARSKIYISYQGQSMYRPHETSPPSVFVQELMEHLDSMNRLACQNTKEESSDFSSSIHYIHHLEPFHHDYFNSQNRLHHSYSHQNFQAASILQKKTKQPLPFWTPETLASRKEQPFQKEQITVEILDLIRFFQNPSCFWLKNNSGIAFPQKKGILQEEEPLETDGLEKFYIRQRILDLLLMKTQSKPDNIHKKIIAQMKKEQLLPHGSLGDLTAEKHIQDIRMLLAQIELHTHSKITNFETKLIPFQLMIPLEKNSTDLSEVILKGNLHAKFCDQNRLHSIYPSTLKAVNFLNAWIWHLVFQLINIQGEVKESEKISYLSGIGKKEIQLFRFTIHSKTALETLSLLVSLYLRGSERTKSPLPFFIKSSFSFAKTLYEKQDVKKAFSSGKQEWEDGWMHKGEGNSIYNQLCFRSYSPFAPPLMDDFEKFSTLVFQPLLENMKDINRESK